MTTLGFEGTPRFGGIGDHARVKVFEDRVLILAVDTGVIDEAVTIVLPPKHARALAQGIIEAAEKAEAYQ